MAGSAHASLGLTAAVAGVLALSPVPAQTLPAPGPDAAVIDGTLAVTITGAALKHWGISAVTAAFVPDTDHSSYARRIRTANDNVGALCAALTEADNRDAAIASARADGDGNLEHRSGDEVRIAFRIAVPRLTGTARGVVYLCSSPVVAVVARGNYPDERFERVADRRFRWVSRPLALLPGVAARLAGTASVDASYW